MILTENEAKENKISPLKGSLAVRRAWDERGRVSSSSLNSVFFSLFPVFELKLKIGDKVHAAAARTNIGWSQVGGAPITGWWKNKGG